MASLTLENLEMQILQGNTRIAAITDKSYDCLDFSLEEGISAAPKAQISIGFRSGIKLGLKDMAALTGCKVMVSTEVNQKVFSSGGDGVSFKRYFYGYIGQIKALSQSKSLKGYKTYQLTLCTEFDRLKKRSTEFKHLSDEKVTDLIYRLLNCDTKDSEKKYSPDFKVEKLDSYTKLAEKLENCKFRIQPQSEESDYQYLLRLCKLFAINFVMVHPAPGGTVFQNTDKAIVYLSHGASIFTNFDKTKSPCQSAPYVKDSVSQDGVVISCSESSAESKYGLSELDYVCKYYDTTEDTLLSTLTADLKYCMSMRDDGNATLTALQKIFTDNLTYSYKFINGNCWSGKAGQLVFVPGIKLALDLDDAPANIVIANARLQIENKLTNDDYSRKGSLCAEFSAYGYENAEADYLSFRLLTPNEFNVSAEERTALSEYYGFAESSSQKIIATVCDGAGNVGTAELPEGTVCIHEDEYANAHPSRFYAKYRDKLLTVEFTRQNHNAYSLLDLPRIGEKIIVDEIDGGFYFDRYALSDADVGYADDFSRGILTADPEIDDSSKRKIVFWNSDDTVRQNSAHAYTADITDAAARKYYRDTDAYLYDQIVNGTISDVVREYYLSGNNTDDDLCARYNKIAAYVMAVTLQGVSSTFTDGCSSLEAVCKNLFKEYISRKKNLRKAENSLIDLAENGTADQITAAKNAVATAKDSFATVSKAVSKMVAYLKTLLPNLSETSEKTVISSSSEIELNAPVITLKGSGKINIVSDESSITIADNEIKVTAASEIDLASGNCLLMMNPFEVMVLASFDPNGSDFLSSCLNLDANTGVALSGISVDVGGYTNVALHDTFGGSVRVNRGCASVSGVSAMVSVNKGSDNILNGISAASNGLADLLKAVYSDAAGKDNVFKFGMMATKKIIGLGNSVAKDVVGYQKYWDNIQNLFTKAGREKTSLDQAVIGFCDLAILPIDYLCKVCSIICAIRKAEKATAKANDTFVKGKNFKDLEYKERGKDIYADIIYYANLTKMLLNTIAATAILAVNCKMNRTKTSALKLQRSKTELETYSFNVVTQEMTEDQSAAAGICLNGTQINGNAAGNNASGNGGGSGGGNGNP